MEKEFNLSEERKEAADNTSYFYWEEDIKDFIKKVEKMWSEDMSGEFISKLHKLAGDKLI